MIKSFGQWIVVNEGIETGYWHPYYGVSKYDIMNKDMSEIDELLNNPAINRQSLQNACNYGYRYFHALNQYSTSHPHIYSQMMAEYEGLKWGLSLNGNYTLQVPEGFTITVYKKPDTERWTWVFHDIYCHRTFKSSGTAKKKAYAGYYWFYKHIKNGGENENVQDSPF
jgi:hypothetical protein